jgi:ATP-dependent HslUV protease subunit HslV
MAADGGSIGATIMKGSAKKIVALPDKVPAGCRIDGGRVLAFARFESMEQYAGNLDAQPWNWPSWRTDKMLRQLEALLIVADQNRRFCSLAPAT